MRHSSARFQPPHSKPSGTARANGPFPEDVPLQSIVLQTASVVDASGTAAAPVLAPAPAPAQ